MFKIKSTGYQTFTMHMKWICARENFVPMLKTAQAKVFGQGFHHLLYQIVAVNIFASCFHVPAALCNSLTVISVLYFCFHVYCCCLCSKCLMAQCDHQQAHCCANLWFSVSNVTVHNKHLKDTFKNIISFQQCGRGETVPE